MCNQLNACIIDITYRFVLHVHPKQALYAEHTITLCTIVIENASYCFWQRDVCLTTQETLNIVDSCPNDNKTHQERSLKKMCHILPRCKRETLVYHCVKYKKNWIEVCAPQGTITGNSNT